MDAEARCDVCGEYNPCVVPNDTLIGEPTNTYCSICNNYTEHTVVEIL